MSARAGSAASAPRRPPWWPLPIGLAAAVVVAVFAVIAPDDAAHGWLIAFLIWSSAPIGALVLGLISLLTGGRWADAIAPTLRAGTACLPFLALFFLPILLGLKTTYPWMRASNAAPDVATLYLNAPSFTLRSIVALAGWAILAVLLIRGRITPLGAGLGLAFHGLAVSVLPVDWALSLDPHFADSAFGAEIAIQQIMAALALAALIQPRRAIERARGDIGALLLAVSLGAFYLALMTFIVKWYGDQPDDADWYLLRIKGPLFAFGLGALCFGALAPIGALSWERVRVSVSALRCIGATVLAGVILHDFWLVAPDHTWSAGLTSLLALVAMAGVSIWIAPQIDRLVCGGAPRSLGVRHGA